MQPCGCAAVITGVFVDEDAESIVSRAQEIGIETVQVCAWVV